METATKKSPLTLILVILTVLALALCAATFLFAYPYIMNPATEMQATEPPTLPPTEPPTDPPTEPPTEPEPTLPPPEANPYGHLDFQYDGRYLACLREETLAGVDVSAYQKNVDWPKVKASGIDFAMVRLGYRGYGSGKLVLDDYYYAHMNGAIAAGLDVGVYFFSQAITPEEAVEEAKFVLSAIAGYNLTMPVVYDWEYISEEARTANVDQRTLTDCSRAFLEVIEEAGYDTLLYFNVYQSRYQLFLPELKDFDFWLAMYTDRMRYPYKIRMWQYTDSGTVPGIEGYADLNLYFPKQEEPVTETP